ncbi:hypothetical protein [uncultured Flavobacterium sp.]|uniref:hypothetical protein n=1 Tax=uncultured Flavobacterium sp. TaxID=165435 RepID=UPI0030EBD3C6|tara:strand:- start:61298 stop:61840 length:543 start_codon:yes stop_codon:yes gene_type:complete
MIVEAYQTLEDLDNIDQIETEGPFDCKRSGAWLGFGYYFWDTNMDWAIAWGENAYKKYGKEYVIGRCKINLANDCFDLVGNVQHQIDLKEVIEVMIRSKKIKSLKDAIVPNVILFMKSKGLFPYKSIRAADMQNNIVQLQFKRDKKEYMVINQRVQICVIEKKDVLLRPFSVIYPEKYVY